MMVSWFWPALHGVVVAANPDAVTTIVPELPCDTVEDKGSVRLSHPAKHLVSHMQFDLRSGDHGSATVFHGSANFLLRIGRDIQLHERQ